MCQGKRKQQDNPPRSLLVQGQARHYKLSHSQSLPAPERKPGRDPTVSRDVTGAPNILRVNHPRGHSRKRVCARKEPGRLALPCIQGYRDAGALWAFTTPSTLSLKGWCPLREATGLT